MSLCFQLCFLPSLPGLGVYSLPIVSPKSYHDLEIFLERLLTPMKIPCMLQCLSIEIIRIGKASVNELDEV